MSKSKDPELQEPVSYPRPETKPKDPDPIAADRWLALGRALVAVGFFTYVAQTYGTGPAAVFEGLSTVMILGICYAAGLGYRVGFGTAIFIGVFEICGILLAWRNGTLNQLGGLAGAGRAYGVMFTLYALLRYCKVLPRRSP